MADKKPATQLFQEFLEKNDIAFVVSKRPVTKAVIDKHLYTVGEDYNIQIAYNKDLKETNGEENTPAN